MDLHKPPRDFDPADVAPPPLPDREWPITSLALDVSGRCNLACRYCAESATQPQRRPNMSKTVLDAALRRLICDAPPDSFKSIRLGSGEPLLARPLLHHLRRRLDEYANAGWRVPEVFITTNGTRLDPATREWLIATGWNLKISLDGPAHVHDRWRVTAKGRPSFDRVSAAVAELAQRIPERFSVTAVLCRDSDPAEVFASIAELGVRRIEMVPVAHHDPDILPGSDDRQNYRTFVFDYADSYGVDDEQPELVRVVNAARRVMGYDVKRVSCGAGRNFIGVGPDGKCYPCFRFIGVDRFCLGDSLADLSQHALQEFQRAGGRSYEARKPCTDCWAAALCGGPCFAEAELFGPGDGIPFALHCEYVKADASAAVSLVKRLRQQDPERLLGLLPDMVDT